MTWQPIETAPRDGTWFVIVLRNGPHYEVGRFDPLMADKYEHIKGDMYRKSEYVAYEWRGFNNFGRATHWMPLTEPPIDPTPQKE